MAPLKTWGAWDHISSQDIYGLYGLKHHSVEISGDVTDAGRTGRDGTSEDSATQLLICEPLSFVICEKGFQQVYLPHSPWLPQQSAGQGGDVICQSPAPEVELSETQETVKF